LELAKDISFDLYVLDVRLPDGTGIELCQKLRALRPGVPVVYYSAYGDAAEVDNALKICGDAYLKKPVCSADIEEVVAKVTRWQKVIRVSSTERRAIRRRLLVSALVLLPSRYDPNAFPPQGATRSNPPARPFGLGPGHGHI
jgi:DNA-binding response OmpR family regulator